MPTTLGRKRVEAVPGKALPHGLLQAANLVPIEDVHVEMGVDWQPLACAVASTTGWCPPDPGDPEREKSFNRVADQSVEPVTVFAGVECAVPGWTFDEAVERARSILNVGEQAALEQWVWENVLAGAATDVSAEVGDTSVTGRLAELEKALAGVYSGTGVVHVPVVLASFMQTMGLVVREGQKLRTVTGHAISIGAGYPATAPNGDDPPAGEAWMYISGPVTVRQGEARVAPDGDAAAINTSTNDRFVLAERTNVVQVECDVFAALVDKECCGAGVSS